MTISIKVLAEPSTFEAEIVIRWRDVEGHRQERIVPMVNGYMMQEYVHSGQELLIREKIK